MSDLTKRFLITVSAIVLIFAFSSVSKVLTAHFNSEAERIRAEQEIEHDQTRPKKIWERK